MPAPKQSTTYDDGERAGDMLGTRFAQSTRYVASTSRTTLRTLHTTRPALASLRQSKGEDSEATAAQRKEQRRRTAEERRVQCVLGTKPGSPDIWSTCDLARILVTPEAIASSPALPTTSPLKADNITIPQYTAFGLGAAEKHMLFEALPALSNEATLTRSASGSEERRQPAFLAQAGVAVDYVEARKANMLARIVDLRNANAKGIAFENRRRCVEGFSEPDKPNDTGRPEVQAALLTMQIRGLWAHLSRCKKDIANIRSLRILVHKRAKILRYLKQTDADRYDRVLGRLGLEPAAVEGELNI